MSREIKGLGAASMGLSMKAHVAKMSRKDHIMSKPLILDMM